MGKTLNFKSKEGYRRWLAFGHIKTKEGFVVGAKSGRNSIFRDTPGNSSIKIRGTSVRVRHSY